jgi:hypothetical protein
MAIQFAVDVINGMLDGIETSIGVSPILKIRSGPPPANCAAADSGTVLATLSLPADWMAAAAGGSKAKSGTWSQLAADATGAAAHYRIYESTGTTAKQQGTVTASGGGGDLELTSTAITAGQAVEVTSFTWTGQV